MQDPADITFGEGMVFPTVPKEKIVDPLSALRGILAGQRSMRRLYASLDSLLSGETHCLVVLLRRDWERRFGDLTSATESILRSLGEPASADEVLPAPEQVDAVVKALQASTPQRVLEVVAAFSTRVLLCHQMVPWVPEIQEVFDHFKACVEAEDAHLAVLDLFDGLIRPIGADRAPDEEPVT
jgi:hypothetical protein